MSEDAQQLPTTEQIATAALLIGLNLTEAECEAMAARVGARAGHFAELREGPLAPSWPTTTRRRCTSIRNCRATQRLLP